MDQTGCSNCQELQRRNAELERRNADLERQLDEAQRAGKRQAAPFRRGEPKAKPKRPGRKSGAAHGRHGHRPPPTPDQVNETLEAPLPCSCPHCGGGVVETEVVQQFQTEIPRRPLIRQFNIHVGQCAECGQRVQGRHPLQTSNALGAAASQLGPDAQAAMTILNKEAGLPHGKIVTCFKSMFGIEVSRGVSAQVNARAAERLTPTYEEIKQAIRESDQVAPDETGWRIGGRPAWLHVWVGESATCHIIDPHRRVDALQDVLGLDWAGTLVHDGFSSYDRFTAATHQQCVAHVLRRVDELLATARGGAVHFPRQLRELFTLATHAHQEYRRGLRTAGELQRLRGELEDRLIVLLVRERTVPAYVRLSNHLLNHFEEWFTFLSDPSIEATNWRAEQAIRPAVVNRKVWGGNRTEAGAKTQGILSSVIATCKQQGQAALDFVSGTLRSFGNLLLPRPVLLLGAKQ